MDYFLERTREYLWDQGSQDTRISVLTEGRQIGKAFKFQETIAAAAAVRWSRLVSHRSYVMTWSDVCRRPGIPLVLSARSSWTLRYEPLLERSLCREIITGRLVFWETIRHIWGLIYTSISIPFDKFECFTDIWQIQLPSLNDHVLCVNVFYIATIRLTMYWIKLLNMTWSCYQRKENTLNASQFQHWILSTEIDKGVHQLPLRRTPSGPASTVRLREVSALEGDEANDRREQLYLSS